MVCSRRDMNLEKKKKKTTGLQGMNEAAKVFCERDDDDGERGE